MTIPGAAVMQGTPYRVFSAALLIAAVLIGAAACKGGGKSSQVDAQSLRGGEARATLPPTHFSGDIAAAYRIASEIPEVLDSLHCYCECKANFGHKSLLTCYVDEHAARCDVCLDEAFMAYELHKQGKDVVSIREAVDKRFSSLRH